MVDHPDSFEIAMLGYAPFFRPTYIFGRWTRGVHTLVPPWPKLVAVAPVTPVDPKLAPNIESQTLQARAINESLWNHCGITVFAGEILVFASKVALSLWVWNGDQHNFDFAQEQQGGRLHPVHRGWHPPSQPRGRRHKSRSATGHEVAINPGDAKTPGLLETVRSRRPN